jgi:ABC-2 type transport system permease protein
LLAGLTWAATILCMGAALVSLSVMPALWPGYWAMESLRSAVEGNRHATLVAVAVLLAFATAGAVIAATRLKHGWGRNSLL